jgi:hypothetical protein
MTFNTWLEGHDQQRTVLLEVDYLKEGVPGTLYLSNRPFTSYPSDTPSDQAYEDVILGGLTYSRQMAGQTASSFEATVSSVDLAPSPEVIEASTYEYGGQAVRVYLGDERWSRDAFELIAVLSGEAITEAGSDLYRLELLTAATDVDLPIGDRRFSSGPNKENKFPLTFGVCLNVQMQQVDDSGLTWTIHDQAVEAINEVRVAGVPTSVTKNTAKAEVRFASPPSGTVTADIEGESASSLKDVLNTLLDRLGVSQRDLSVLDTLPEVAVSLALQGEETFRTAFDLLLRSVGGFWGFTRFGVFRVGLLERPQGSPFEILTPDDILLDGVSFESRIEPLSEIALTYDVNHTNQEGRLSDTLPPEQLAIYSRAGSVVTAVNNGIDSFYPLAKPSEASTVLVGQVSAQAEAERRALFRSSPLRTYRVEAFAVPFRFDIGQEIELIYPYFGMADGRNGVILKITDSPLEGTTQLEVLTNG